MNTYTIIAGVNGTGKSSFRGILEGERGKLGYIIDPDEIAKEKENDLFAASKEAVRRINECLDGNICFTQETTLSGRSVLHTAKMARAKGYEINLYYIGLSSAEESIDRIKNRVRKGGHNIPEEDVLRRFKGRFETLRRLIPYCDRVSFYDNENGFVKVGEILNGRFAFLGSYKPEWLCELSRIMTQGI